PITVLCGPVVAEVEHRPGMGVPAAGGRVGPLAAARAGPVAAAPVEVVGATLDQTETVRVQVLAVHADEVSAGHDVEEMLDDTVGDEQLAVLVPVQAPGVGGARGHQFEGLARRVVAPYAAVQGRAFLLWRARRADQGLRLDAVAAIQPAVGSPGQAVE